MNDASSSDFVGKVALVTGAGRGIGRNISRALNEKGAMVAICDIDAEKGLQTHDELAASGIRSEFFHVDLSIIGEPQRLVDAVLDSLGRLDVIVNNARAAKRLSFTEENEDNWDLAMAVNLRSVFFLAQASVPRMSEGGAIINISSVSATVVTHEAPSYQVSKAGVLHLTRYLATIAGRRGIRVNAILPGFVVQDEHRTRYEKDDNALYREVAERVHPLRGGPGGSDHIASTVVFLASSNSAFITGQAIVVDGGLTIQDPATLCLSRMRD